MCLKQHWVTVHRPTVLMHIPCAEWCAWSNTELQCTGPQCLCTSRVQNDVLEATLSYSAQAHSAYAHPVCRMMCLKQHWVTVRRPTVLMHIPCAEWCAWSNTESARRPTVLMHIPCAKWCAWSNTESQRFRVHIEKFKAQRKEILRCFNLIDLTVLNVSYCACEEPLIVLSTTVSWSNRHLIESNTI